MVMRIVFLTIAILCFTACGTKEKRDASLLVMNQSDEEIMIEFIGSLEVRDISRKLTIPPRFSGTRNWDYKVKKNYTKETSKDVGAELVVKRTNQAVLLWTRLHDVSSDDLNLVLWCDIRNCILK